MEGLGVEGGGGGVRIVGGNPDRSSGERGGVRGVEPDFISPEILLSSRLQ